MPSGSVYEFDFDRGAALRIDADLALSVTGNIDSTADACISVTQRLAFYTDMTLLVAFPVVGLADIEVLITHPTTTCADVIIVILGAQGRGSGVAPVKTYRDPSLEFLGKGLKFPFTFQRRSGGTQISTATSSDHAHIHESIRQIFGTRKGERFLRPEFGTRLHELVFEPNDAILYGLIRHEVISALDQWEPRVIVTDVLVGPGDDEHLVLVDIRYRLISSQVEGNLVWPFFRELE